MIHRSRLRLGIASTETPPTDSARTTSREHGTSRPHATAALDDSSSASVDSHALPQSSANQAVSGNLPFDRDAAAKVLATLDLYACTTNETPSGAVHLSVTFASDGSVSNAAVDRPPYLGTPFADCIAEKAKAQRVPPFGGGPVSVGKSFSLLSRFDSAAATRAIAAVDLGPCKPLNGPTGAGHVMLTFANDGTASATVDQPPYAGTPIARCIANRYHDVHIPAFGGPSTRVGKAFSF